VLTLPICQISAGELKDLFQCGEGLGDWRLRSLIVGNLLSAWCTLSLSAASPRTTLDLIASLDHVQVSGLQGFSSAALVRRINYVT